MNKFNFSYHFSYHIQVVNSWYIFFSCTATTLPDTKSLLPKKISPYHHKNICLFFFKPNSFFIDKNSCQSEKFGKYEFACCKISLRTHASIPKCHKVLHFANSNLAFGVNFKSCRVRGPIPSSLSYFNLEFLILVFGNIPSLYHIFFIFRLKISP